VSARAAPLAVALAVAVSGAAADPVCAAARGEGRASDLIARVDVEQHLGAPLPLEAAFRNENGAAVTLGSYFGRRPVVLALVYYDCPMLCTLVLNGLVRALRPLELEAGRDFDVVVVSFDPKETPDLALAKKAVYVDAYARSGSEHGWHFLTGDDEQIRALTGALGFRYAYDAERGEYAHAAAIYVATPQGRVARYLFGVEYSARDVRLSLVEASDGQIATLADKLLLLCYHYDPRTGTYTRAALGAMRAAGALTVVSIVLLVFAMQRRERRRGDGR
jgi:protein SCO1/2